MQFAVNGQTIQILNPEKIVSEAVNLYECLFAFSSEWDGYEKTAVFMAADGGTWEQLLVSDRCLMPWEVVSRAENGRLRMRVGVYGIKDNVRMPTVFTQAITIHLGASPADSAIPATPTQYEQLLSLIAEKVDKEAGMGLSHNDFDDDDVNKLGGIETGAQRNIIETVKVNGDEQDVTDKTVDIIVPADYLPIANDRIYGSLEIGQDRSAQGMTSFSAGGKEYIVFATANNDAYPIATNLYLYNYTDDLLLANVDVYRSYNVYGHYNDMTYCPKDGYIYVANNTFQTIDVFAPVVDGASPSISYVRTIDMTSWGDSEDYPMRPLNGIAWSEKEECFYISFTIANGGVYRTSYDFGEYEQMSVLNANLGEYGRQGMYIEKSTGNIMVVKFRTSNTFSFPRGNRIQIYDTSGSLVAVTYINSRYEIESITEMSDGQMMFLFYATDGYSTRNVPEGDLTGRKHVALFCLGAVSAKVGIERYMTYAKNYLNTSDFMSQTNNIYYREDGADEVGANGIAETGGNPLDGGKPYKSWASIANYLNSTTTKTLNIHLLSDLNWPVRLVEYDRAVVFVGEDDEQIDEEDIDREDETETEGEGGEDEDEDEGEDSEGTELRAIRDVVLIANKSSIKFDRIASGGRRLALARNEQVDFASCEITTTDENTVRQGVFLTPAYSPASTYAVGDMVYYKAGVEPSELHKEKLADLYSCTTAITSPEPWNENHWELVIANSHPASPYDSTEVYEQNKIVVYEGAYYQRNAWEGTPSAEEWNAEHWTLLANTTLPADSWRDNDRLFFTACDFSRVNTVDTYRTRLLLLKETVVYGANTRFENVGGVVRIYNTTTADEQYVLRGMTSGTSGVTCNNITAISALRMNMNINVPSANSARFTDLPYYVRGLPFAGRCEVLDASKMLYLITQGGEEYRRIVTFGDDGTGRTLAITDDSGWLTRDNELYPINTVVRSEARQDRWSGGRILLLGDSIATSSYSETYWIDDVAAATECSVLNRARGGARFATSNNTIINQLGDYARAIADSLDTLALYRGSWGNDLSYAITANGDAFDVTVSLDGTIVLTYENIATVGELKTVSASNLYIVFRAASGYSDASPLVATEGVSLSGGVDILPSTFTDVTVVIIAAGTNDASNSNVGGAAFRASVEAVITAIRENTDAPIIFITPIRRGRDTSGAADTQAYSRLRFVGAAICNVAMAQNCSVINGFDFPIAVSGSDWVVDMTIGDGLHPAEQGKKVYAQSFMSAVGFTDNTVGSPTYYATCATAGATAAKEATTLRGDFTLEVGAMIRVVFTYDQSVSDGNATLNVDGTGAIPISRVAGIATSTKAWWRSGQPVDFVYTGAAYVAPAFARATTTYYGLALLTNDLGTSEGLAMTQKGVKDAIDALSARITALGG